MYMSNETPTLEERVEAVEAELSELKKHTHTVRAFNQAMQIRSTSPPVIADDD
jgi:hypothetical protein